MTTEELTTKVEAANDPAKKLGTTETWNGTDVHVLRNSSGQFVTWRKASAGEASSAPVAVADGGHDELSFTTDRGADVTVRAESGTLFVTFDAGNASVEDSSARLDREKGMDVLDAGTHRDNSGERFRALIPVDDRRDEIEQLREDSKDDSPLTYEVEEYSKGTGSWGQELTGQKLVPSKSYNEMTEREQDLSMKVDTDRVPDDAEPGDVLTFEDLLDDARTNEEKDEDALDEAAETGEEVVINKSTTSCNDSSKECNLDHVTRVATPEGDIESRRTHTY
ncbi:hypothetical protein D3D01_16025 [Haloarcula sp. Atlit-7R]|nr:hypothetical protein D3D01_16025 [Haloarcula sp. Atlit-7R]